MSKSTTFGYIMTLVFILTGCYSFDKEVALKEFKELKPNSELIKMTDYECSGTMGECWYGEFKYKDKDSGTINNTTLQYWNVDDKWITRDEYLKKYR